MLFATREDFIVGGIAAGLAFVLVSACAPKGKKVAESESAAVLKDCVLPTEQADSIQGRWGTAPIKVSVHAGDFDASEVSAIQAGGESWNGFFSASKGFQIFDLGVSGVGNQSGSNQVSPDCNSGTLADGTVLYKRFANWTHSAAAVAVTTTCFTISNTGGLPTIFNAIMEFNYVNFYTAGSGRFPDMQSIATHELGHLLGLDHSCGPLGRPNQNKSNVACPDYTTEPDHPLISTVMFPQVFFDQFGGGEIKRDLTSNDQGRANCAYSTSN